MSPPHILFVDDDRSTRHAAQELLTEEGYRVSIAANGKDAIQFLTHSTPAIVLTDLQMPVMDGFELLAHIGRQLPNVPVILMTAHTAIDAERTARSLGAVGFINKPMNLDLLLEVVRTALTGDR